MLLTKKSSGAPPHRKLGYTHKHTGVRAENEETVARMFRTSSYPQMTDTDTVLSGKHTFFLLFMLFLNFVYFLPSKSKLFRSGTLFHYIYD